MPRLILNAYPAEYTTENLLSIQIVGKSPMPSRIVEVKNVADCEAAFQSYKVEAEATGAKLAVSMLIHARDRKPAGFDKLRAAKTYETVNL